MAKSSRSPAQGFPSPMNSQDRVLVLVSATVPYSATSLLSTLPSPGVGGRRLADGP